MTVKISKKIVGYQVKDKKKADAEAKAAADAPARSDAKEQGGRDGRGKSADIIRMHEKLQRPEGMECLEGATYKIRTPLDDHALYVTINDIVLNAGTEHEQRRPFEIFINSKNMDHFQWIVALTRVMSAVFRKGGDVTFLSEELQAVFDPKGGYFKPGGRFVPSIVADIGAVVETHLKRIGLLEPDELSEQQQLMLKEKRAEIEAREQAANAEKKTLTTPATADAGDYPASATLCHKCSTKAMVLLDGCQTCLACGYSKCG
ncbi:NrdJb [Wenzhouxiangella sp. XN79A]|nr:NrdJb [Wenzhouxiangella sp. XN79A]NKI36294.1 NrdJb [Wenzhouxiangella sp. XN79A]